MDNRSIILNVVRTRNMELETLEQIAEKVANACKKEAQRFQQRRSFLVNEPVTPTKVELDENQEAELRQIVTRASQSPKPENDTEFLVSIPDLHNSWYALKLLSENKELQKVYAMIMLAIYQGKIPVDAETRILCLDNVDSFAQTLNRCGQEWSRRAKTIMRTQHPDLYNKLFECPRVYFTFMD